MNEKILILIVEFALAFALLAVFVALTIHRRVRFPQPMVIGCIIPKVCAVVYEQARDHFDQIDNWRQFAGKLRREALRKQFRVTWGYLREQALNTKLFLAALRFEKDRIDALKSGFEYEQREVLIIELIDEAVELRWKQIRWQLAVFFRSKLRLSISQQVTSVLVRLLNEYKQLEEEIVALVRMEHNCYGDMLVERLGLLDFGNNGGSDPS
jgi:hypothetical protein